MSRSDYSDDCYGVELTLWRGAVRKAMNGKRGQAFLREMVVAMDALPEKRLAVGALVSGDGYCALGAVGRSREIEMTDGEVDRDDTARMFGVAPAMTAEIMDVNDRDHESPEERFARVRAWAVAHVNGSKL